MTLNSFPSCLMSKSQWTLPLTLTGVRHEANSGMTIQTLVHSSDTFSYHCNYMNTCLSIVISHLAQAIAVCV